MIMEKMNLDTLYDEVVSELSESKGMKLAKRIETLFNSKCKEFKNKYKMNFGVYYTPKHQWVA